MATIGRLIIKIGGDTEDLEKSSKKSQKIVKDLSGKIGKFTKGLAGAGLKIGLAATGAGIVAVGTAAVKAASDGVLFADDFNSAMDEVAASTQLTTDQLSTLRDLSGEVFGANFGDNITDVVTVMGEANKQTGLLDDRLKGVATSALVMRDRFDQDVGKSINAIDVLMEQFGLTSMEATNFLFTGLQRGLDSSGDFLDTVTEYSNLFSEGQASASQFFSILETGLAGGVLGTDKVADAYKEFSIRLFDGSKTTTAALDALGIDIDSVFQRIDAGQITTTQAFDWIIALLGQVESEFLQKQIAVQLFGTQFEDLGAKAALAIDSNATSLADMQGATDKAIESNTGLRATIQELGRNFLLNIEPAAQEIIPLLASGLEKAGNFVNKAAPIFKLFALDLKDSLGPAIEIIFDALKRIGVALGIATDNTSNMEVALGILKGTLDLIVTGIKAVAIVAHILADAFEIASGLVDQIRTLSRFGGRRVAGAALSQLLNFDGGGTVPGAPGVPSLAIVHGQENIRTPGQVAQDNRTFNLNFSGGVSRDPVQSFSMIKALS